MAVFFDQACPRTASFARVRTDMGDVRSVLSEETRNTRLPEQASLRAPGSRVYFVACPEARAIKIGTTNKMAHRFSQLQVACPLELRILVTVLGGIGIEKALHAHFADIQIRGEWFRAEEDLLQFIETLTEGYNLGGLVKELRAQRIQNDVADLHRRLDEIQARNGWGRPPCHPQPKSEGM